MTAPSLREKAVKRMAKVNEESMENRTPTDGLPYYCTTCGLGWAEYVACEDSDCRIEDESVSRRRAQESGLE